LAFGDGPSPQYRPPRWPDPDYPQQLHLDMPVSDLQAADELALRLGATRLQDKGEYRSYADPVGRPFCLYRDSARPSGEIGRVVFDCFSPRALASFYAQLLDMPKRPLDTPHLVLRLGAIRLPGLGGSCPVYADPAGHPFCLCSEDQ
jgi:hypothetical protein